MNTNLKKRFWTTTKVAASGDGFGVFLDERPLKTPAKADLVVPKAALGDAIAAEWDALGDQIDPQKLPFTKLANAAIDNMAEKAGLVVEALTAYAETDLLCYRADSPEELVARQSQSWDPILDWIRDRHEIFFVSTVGIMPVEQPMKTVQKFEGWLKKMDKFELMAAHDLIMMSGSIVLARAVIESHLSADEAWKISTVDDLWQEDVWGVDEDAAELRAQKGRDFARAAQLYQLLSD